MKSSFLLALSATTALLSACAKDHELPTPTPQPVANVGYVRLVNNLAKRPGGNVQQGPVQLEVGGQPMGPATAEGTATPYQTIATGEPTVWIRLPSTSGQEWIHFSKLAIAKNRRYSLFTHNNGAYHSARVVEEDALPTPVAGKAYLRVLNLAAESTPVRIEEPAQAPLYMDVAWGSLTSYQAVDARSYSLYATRTNGNFAPLFNQGVVLAAGKAYTLVMRGSTAPDAVSPEKLAFDVIVDE